jgi:Lhr-like helicase
MLSQYLAQFVLCLTTSPSPFGSLLIKVDIGEVDLIVNFDCLSSPIRMIQRVGRTGRKREGRVVTLVAEGQEEKTYDVLLYVICIDLPV